MKKKSAGLLVYRQNGANVEVLLVHPGGPFWAKRNLGAWSIPKGEYSDDENAMTTAKREFEEELGHPSPAGDFVDLGTIVQTNKKQVRAWAVEGELDTNNIQSNSFEMEWPPKSGRQQKFPEVDRAEWVPLQQAAAKMHTGQGAFVERLAKLLKIAYRPQADPPSQAALL